MDQIEYPNQPEISNVFCRKRKRTVSTKGYFEASTEAKTELIYSI